MKIRNCKNSHSVANSWMKLTVTIYYSIIVHCPNILYNDSIKMILSCLLLLRWAMWTMGLLFQFLFKNKDCWLKILIWLLHFFSKYFFKIKHLTFFTRAPIKLRLISRFRGFFSIPMAFKGLARLSPPGPPVSRKKEIPQAYRHFILPNFSSTTPPLLKKCLDPLYEL